MTDQEMLQALHRYLTAELRRFALTQREQTVAQVVLDLSYGEGMRSVAIPRLTLFTELTGITKNNVSDTLRKLHETRILTVTAKDNLRIYTLQPDSNAWQAHPRFSRAQQLNAIQLIKTFNGQAEATDPKTVEAILHVQTEPLEDEDGTISDPDPGGEAPSAGVLNPSTVQLSFSPSRPECPELV